ncbi:hypothetical protein HOK51_09905 [Candidatus Woesearchaeota archaeon]|jgi:hypothetical protein|nr:hypothetical protein [Candidatus Woesearchaeota archaeon]MBT6520137.1 hypothetical protein [Candidatus Woesearchaeota archaeon]MBT7366742.1 hypothetical protein [Candidatus Woesearchaeota archaeon]
MNIIEIKPNQLITLNDYPVHRADKLESYFNKCRQGSELALIPVIKKEIAKKYLDPELREEFEQFEKENPFAEYFMLDGSHRTTALNLTHHNIQIIIYETDEDIIRAKEMMSSGKVLENDTLNHNLEENCKMLNKHFKQKKSFMTVEEKTKRMVEEQLVSQNMIQEYTTTKNQQ